MSLPFFGGTFYESVAIDTTQPLQPAVELSLAQAMAKYQHLYDWDLQYCRLVEGAANETNLWVVRNTDKLNLSDSDLASFKNFTWNEVIAKKFDTAVNPNASLLDMVRQFNLQYHSMEVRGLHPKIEAAEKQTVLQLMHNKILPFTHDVDQVALRLRRSPTLATVFANAIGCRVCALTGRTPGLSKTQYNSDLDYMYKREGWTFLCEALKKFKLEPGPQIDYVLELSKLLFLTAAPTGPAAAVPGGVASAPAAAVPAAAPGAAPAAAAPAIDLTEVMNKLEEMHRQMEAMNALSSYNHSQTWNALHNFVVALESVNVRTDALLARNRPGVVPGAAGNPGAAGGPGAAGPGAAGPGVMGPGAAGAAGPGAAGAAGLFPGAPPAAAAGGPVASGPAVDASHQAPAAPRRANPFSPVPIQNVPFPHNLER